MIVFFIILTILFLITSFFLLLLLSNIEIEIAKLWFDSSNIKEEKLENFLFYIRLKFLDKITWFKIRIDSKKIIKIKKSKLLKSKTFEKISKMKNIKESILKNKKEIINIRNLKDLDIKIEQLNLDMKISASDYIITSFFVAFIASVISIILAKNIKRYEKNKYRYLITPIYEYKPTLKIKLNCIIDIKIVHIMNVIYMLVKKRSVEYDERTSDRRTYVCSND